MSKLATIVLIALIVACIAAIIYVVTTGKEGEPFTEFYILGPEGKATNYPRDIKLGASASVIVGIVNHEHTNITYRIEVRIDGATSQFIPDIAIASEQKWERAVSITPTKAGDNQKIEFLLYKNAETEPSLSLNLWVNVK